MSDKKKKPTYDERGFAFFNRGDRVEHESGDLLIAGENARVRMRSGGLQLPAARPSLEQARHYAKDAPAPGQPVSESLRPKAEDYLDIPWRMLSKLVVDGWYFDYSEGNVLKNALPMFGNVPILTDHRAEVRNWCGVTINPRWSTDGEVPGIDADYHIDLALDRRVTRGLLMVPPAIRSSSVTVWVRLLRSHPEMDLDEFWALLGDDVNGDMVRFIVKEITDVSETSLVVSGADPLAKRQDLSRPRTHSALHSKSKNTAGGGEPAGEGLAMKTKLKRSLVVRLGLDPQRFGFAESTAEREVSGEELEAILEAASGRLEHSREQSKTLTGRLGQFARLFVDKDGAALSEFPEEFDFAAGLSELEATLAEPRARIAELRKQTLGAYRAGLGGNAEDPQLVELLESASATHLAALAKQFGAKLEEKHPLKCAKCGHAAQTRASSEAPDEPGRSADEDLDDPGYEPDEI